jgi:hypothetical protein
MDYESQEGGMVKKALILILGVIVLTLVLSATALAATPQDIYNDYAAHGKLDKTYTSQEITAYLNDAQIHQYGDRNIIDPLDKLLSRDTYPFTGADIAYMAAGAIVLIGGGIALRHWAKAQKS